MTQEGSHTGQSQRSDGDDGGQGNSLIGRKMENSDWSANPWLPPALSARANHTRRAFDPTSKCPTHSPLRNAKSAKNTASWEELNRGGFRLLPSFMTCLMLTFLIPTGCASTGHTYVSCRTGHLYRLSGCPTAEQMIAGMESTY